MRKIIGLEIENPYRYRSYFIGSCAKYDVQNASYIAPKDEINDDNLIEEIEKVETDPFVFTYYVRYQNGNWPLQHSKIMEKKL